MLFIPTTPRAWHPWPLSSCCLLANEWSHSCSEPDSLQLSSCDKARTLKLYKTTGCFLINLVYLTQSWKKKSRNPIWLSSPSQWDERFSVCFSLGFKNEILLLNVTFIFYVSSFWRSLLISIITYSSLIPLCWAIAWQKKQCVRWIISFKV